MKRLIENFMLLKAFEFQSLQNFLWAKGDQLTKTRLN
jgi:hypothetical protein